MKWLLDTNVVSEMVRPRPNRNVLRWLADRPREQTAISAVTLAELRSGAVATSDEERRTELTRWLEDQIEPTFRPRILVPNVEILIEWIDLMKRMAASRHSRLATDLLIAATARVHNLTIVTRNVRDYAGAGVTIFDPWLDQTHTLDRL